MKYKYKLISFMLIVIVTLLPIASYGDTSYLDDDSVEPISIPTISYDLSNSGSFESNYDNTYKYDSIGFDTTYESECKEVWIANTYERSIDTNESLNAISFYTLDDDIKYEVYFSDRKTRMPNNKYLKHIHSGWLDTAGYHTIELPESIELKKNNFTISVQLSSQDKDLLIPIDSMKDISNTNTPSFDSFIRINSKSYKHLSKIQEGSQLCLRAFTNNMYEGNDLLSPEDMKDDLDFLVALLRENHSEVKIIGFDKKQLAVIDSVYSNIKKPMYIDNFYFEVNKTLTMLKDYTTHLDIVDLRDNRYLDIPIIWLEDGIYITKDTKFFKAGDEIVSIGGMHRTQLLNQLWECLSSENKYWIMNQASRVLTHEAFLNKLNLLLNKNYVQISYKRDGKTSIINHALVNNPQYIYTYNNQKLPEWSIDKEDNLGVLNIGYWSYNNEIESSSKILNDFFKEVSNKEIDNICLDLRNTEGNSYFLGKEILSYLNLGPLYKDGYIVNNHYKDIIHKDDELIFSGNIFLMTSNKTTHYSMQFATLLSDNGEAYTIGEPTGASPAANAYSYNQHQLPKSGLKFRMSTYLGFRAGNLNIEDDSKYPDIPVNRTIEDFISNTDSQLEMLKKYTKGIISLPLLNSIDTTGKNVSFRGRKKLYLYNKLFKERSTLILDTNNSRVMNATSVFYDGRGKNHYVCVSFRINISNELFDPNRFYLTDASGDIVKTTCADRARTVANNLVFSPVSVLKKGHTYTMHIKPGSFKDESGKWNSNYIEMRLVP